MHRPRRQRLDEKDGGVHFLLLPAAVMSTPRTVVRVPVSLASRPTVPSGGEPPRRPPWGIPEMIRTSASSLPAPTHDLTYREDLGDDQEGQYRSHDKPHRRPGDGRLLLGDRGQGGLGAPPRGASPPRGNHPPSIRGRNMPISIRWSSGTGSTSFPRSLLGTKTRIRQLRWRRRC